MPRFAPRYTCLLYTSSCLDDITKQALVTLTGDSYTITDKGRKVAQELAYDLPRSVRERAVAAVLR